LTQFYCFTLEPVFKLPGFQCVTHEFLANGLKDQFTVSKRDCKPAATRFTAFTTEITLSKLPKPLEIENIMLKYSPEKKLHIFVKND